MKTTLKKTSFVVLYAFFACSILLSEQATVPTVEYLFRSQQANLSAGDKVFGTIVQIKYSDPDLFTKKRFIDTIVIGGETGTIQVFVFSEDYPEGKFALEDTVFIQNHWGLMLDIGEKTGMCAGEVVDGEFEIQEWTGEENVPEHKAALTVGEYFDDGIAYGDRTVVLTGTVFEFDVAGDGNYYVILKSSNGDEIMCWYDSQYWKNNERLQEILRSIEVGQELSVRGAFLMEIDFSTLFDIASIE
jgi:hypothetical protein